MNDLNNKKGVMLVLSSPSGAGKSSICKSLMNLDTNLSLSISTTTRKKRPNEKSGEDYMFVNTENQYLNKVSTCFLESMDVSYADGKFKTHQDGQPVETTITLNFKEIELITRDKLAEGF